MKFAENATCVSCGISSGGAASGPGTAKALREKLEAFWREQGWAFDGLKWWCPACKRSPYLSVVDNG